MTDPAERLADLVEDTIPIEDDEVVFDAPWQARLVGLAMGFHEHHEEYDWSVFQERLTEKLAETDPQTMQEDVENVYYEQWLGCFEELLIEEEILSPEDIDCRKQEFSEGERDASEFVFDDPAH